MSGTPRCIKPHINHRNKKALQPDLIWPVPCYCRCSLAFFPFVFHPFLLDLFPRPTRLLTRRLFSPSARMHARVGAGCCKFYHVHHPIPPRSHFLRVASRYRDIQCAKFQYRSCSEDFNKGLFPAITLRVATICTTAIVDDVIFGTCYRRLNLDFGTHVSNALSDT